MEELFARPQAQVRMHEGPLGAHIDAFIRPLVDKGYATDTMRRAAWLVADYSRWLARRRIAVSDLRLGHADAFLRGRKRRRAPRDEDRPTLMRLMEHLANTGAIAPTTVERTQTPAQQLEAQFVEYLRRERNLAPATVQSNRLDARRFLVSVLGEGKSTLEHIGPQDIIAHIRLISNGYRPSSAGRVVGNVRSFLRFAHCVGLISVDLSKCILAPARWSLSSIPRALEEDQVWKILKHCDRTTANGSRDYAILLLLARLGLRAGEVATLQLEDIDWRTGELQVRNGERSLDRMPLPHDVGEALAAYLSAGRPPCSCRHVFVRSQAPREGFASGTAIASIVRRALRRADLNPPCKGAHALRHALATQLLRQGASLAEIGDVLRHQHHKTTMIYAKVDMASLRTVTAPWPGGVQ